MMMSEFALEIFEILLAFKGVLTYLPRRLVKKDTVLNDFSLCHGKLIKLKYLVNSLIM